MKKKILVFETNSTISGGQTMTLLVASLLKDIYDFVFIIPEEGPLSNKLKDLSLNYYCCGAIDLPHGVKRIKAIFSYLKISKRNSAFINMIINKEHPDLLYCPGPAALPWMSSCAKKNKIPVVWHLHHVFLDKKTKILLNHYSKYNDVKKIICVSNEVSKQLTNNKAISKTITIYNPVDFNKYSSGTDLFIDEIKKLIDLDFYNNSIIVAHIGNIQKEKRQDFTIKLNDLYSKKYNQKVTCLFVGKTVDSDFAQQLQIAISENTNPLVKNIILGERNDIPNILRVLKCLIIPSHEGFPLAGLEAMCAGVPIVGACGGAGELIKNSNGGEVFEYDDLLDASNSMKKVIDGGNYSHNAVIFASKLTNDNYRENIYKVFEEAKDA